MISQHESERQSYAMTNKLWKGVIQSTVTWFNVAVLIAVLFSILLASNEQYAVSSKIITVLITITGVSIGVIRGRKRNSKINKNPLTAIIAYTALVTIALLVVAKVESPFAFIYTMPIFLVALYYRRRHVYMLLAFIFVVLMIQPITFYAITPNYAPDPNLTIEDFSNNLTTFLMIVIVARLIIVTTLVNEEDRKLMQKAATKLHEEQEKTLGLIETVDIGIVTLSENMIIEESNSSFKSMFNLEHQLEKENITDILAPVDSEHNLNKILQDITSKNDSRVIELKTRNDRLMELDITAKKITLGSANKENYKIVAAFQDVTDLKSKSDSRKLIASLLSHEFKTLLKMIEKRLSTIPSKIENNDSKNNEFQQQVKDANEDVNNLKELNNKIIRLLDSGQINSKENNSTLNLEKLSKDIYTTFEPIAKISGVDFQIQTIGKIKAPVITNIELLRLSLDSIIENALKFCSEGIVSVSVKPEIDSLKFIISDTGKGMTNSTVEHLNSGDLIQPEYLDRRNREGLGIGLIIARKQISALKGSLKFESELDKGTTVEVSIPLNN